MITGSSGMLGRQHAAALLEVGAYVVLTDVDVDGLGSVRDELMESFDGDGIRTIPMDVTEIESIREVADVLGAEGVEVNALINNASLDPKVGEDGLTEGSRLETFPLQRWDAELAVGLTGAFLCSQVFGSRLKATLPRVSLSDRNGTPPVSPQRHIYPPKVECGAR